MDTRSRVKAGKNFSQPRRDVALFHSYLGPVGMGNGVLISVHDEERHRQLGQLVHRDVLLDALHQESAHVQLESALVPEGVLRDLLLHLRVGRYIPLRDAPVKRYLSKGLLEILILAPH